jgi:hypothetical protein
MAAAPSFIREAFPAVTVPSGPTKMLEASFTLPALLPLTGQSLARAKRGSFPPTHPAIVV